MMPLLYIAWINRENILLVSRVSVRYRWRILGYVYGAEAKIGMRLQETLHIPLALHARPKRDPVKLVVGDSYNSPALSFQQSVLEHRVT